MKFELPPLPYAKDALEPHLSARTLDVHYEGHHRGYLTKLERAIGNKPEAEKQLEEIIRTSNGSVFNNAAQVWNHTFYWNSMKPGGGGRPGDKTAAAIESSFGSYDQLRERFIESATGLFGSGYVWLYVGPRSDRLTLEATPNADNPIAHDAVPILGMDMWEHAYYLDYQNKKGGYIEAFFSELVNWDFAEENLRKAS